MIEIKPTPRGIGLIHILLLLALIAAASVGYKAYENNNRIAEIERQEAQQREEAAHAAELAKITAERKAKITSILNKWNDALKLAGLTPRIALAQPVSQMQAIRRELDELRINECFDGATRKIVTGMNDAIFAFEMFARFPNNRVATVSTEQNLTSSSEKINAGKQMMNRCE